MWAGTQSPVLVLGTAHVVDLEASLRQALEGRPLDAIALELDEERASALLTPGRPDRRHRSGAPLLARLWGRLQERLGAEIGGGVPGAEMRVGAAVAKERGLPLLLIDDPLREILGNLLRSLSFRERLALFGSAVLGLFVPARFVERQMDRYNESPQPFLEEIRVAYPTVTRVLLDDRNEHMADRIAAARRGGYAQIAAIVGDAHVPGLTEALGRRSIPVEAKRLAELSPAATVR